MGVDFWLFLLVLIHVGIVLDRQTNAQGSRLTNTMQVLGIGNACVQSTVEIAHTWWGLCSCGCDCGSARHGTPGTVDEYNGGDDSLKGGPAGRSV